MDLGDRDLQVPEENAYEALHAASILANIHRLAGEIGNLGNPGGRDQVQFLVEKPRHIDELAREVAKCPALLQPVDHVLVRERHIDAGSMRQHILDVVNAAAPQDRPYPQGQLSAGTGFLTRNNTLCDIGEKTQPAALDGPADYAERIAIRATF